MARFTYDRQNFLLDGKPFRILSGAMHYFRTVPGQWEDRLKKIKACGFNTVETYVCWNLHEPKEGVFDFTGLLDVRRFVELAGEIGLYVVLRPGPYICAEWEFGGFPSWLLADQNIRLRCADSLYLSKVRRYYEALFAELTPTLLENGGNILMVQIENEYGSFGNDKIYLQAIVDIYKECGVNSLLFTADGPHPIMLGGGSLEGHLVTVNFGADPKGAFQTLRDFAPDQPQFCCEYYGNGWFDHWYEPHHNGAPANVAAVVDEILSEGASVNFYMFLGGTNFNFWNGANHEGNYTPTVTSYDYGAPLSEAGDMTEKYYAVKEVLEKHFGAAPVLDVQNSVKKAYGSVKLTEAANLFDHLPAPVKSPAPLTFEKLGQNFGYVLYRTTLTGEIDNFGLNIDGLRDRALIYLDGVYQGVYERGRENAPIYITVAKGKSAELSILVENMGRINYGIRILDPKGILHGVRLGSQFQFGWEHFLLPMDNLQTLEFATFQTIETDKPIFFRGILDVVTPADSFVRLDGLKKGFVVINGFNIGRYFNTAGPQKTLYVPAPLLRVGKNEIVVFESEGYAGMNPEIQFLDTPELG